MRTLILSDLHLGCGPCPGIFAGSQALGGLLSELGAGPLRVVLNGDTFDYWAQVDHRDGAARVTQALLEDPVNAELLTRLGEVVRAGGALVVRGGEHDRDLVAASARARVLAALKLVEAQSAHVTWHRLLTPSVLDVGAARLIVARGGRGHEAARRLAELLLNPLRRQYGVGFADLLRPDYVASVLAALAVNPTAAKLVLRQLADVGWHRLRSDCERALRLTETLAAAGLSAREREVFGLALDPEVPLGDAFDSHGALELARLKLFRHSLGRRPETDADGLRSIAGAEWHALRALARRRHASAAVIGHSHIAGWRSADGLTVADTGTWTWRVETPEASASVASWRETMASWQDVARVGLSRAHAVAARARFTAAWIEPRPAGQGAHMALVEWRPGHGLVVLREQELARAH
ncbi:MAG: hypothetical protein IPO88_13030 [Nannocystis sp.]|uniref:hypothetical protein n=1 Tax=Nannocystis sp. TaxID=1962667 RepID=UPI0024271655|nr:hypothetical protein [Nannocystis sp.]MBK9754406.1 hypothetical protein [Nannocystis sp.]